MLFGSLGLLLAQLLLWRDDSKTHPEEEDYGQVPAYTAIVLCSVVVALSVAALIVHLLSVFRLNQLQKPDREALKREQGEDDKSKEDGERAERSIWEWFFYPERETVPAARQARINKRMQLLARRIQTMFRQFGWSSQMRVFLLAPSLALFGMMIFRLYWGVDNFEGLPYYLDFGWKHGVGPRNVFEDRDEVSNEAVEKNTAFIPELNTYGHVAQGFFSALLAFPVVTKLLLNCAPKAWWWRSVVHLAPFALATYPTYSLIKRVLKAGESFASSSFANNSLEWTSGFMVACAIGNFWTSIVLYRRLLSDEFEAKTDESGDTSDDNEGPHWQLGSNQTDDGDKNKNDDINKTSACIKMIQILLGTVFAFTVTLASILYGLTWHGCDIEDSPEECVNFSPDGERARNEVSVAFLLFAVVALVGASVMECCRRGK